MPRTLGPCPILAFGHQSRVGKDTAARAIVRSFDANTWDHPKIHHAHHTSFAAALKGASHQVFGHYGLKDGPFYERPENAHLRDIPLDTINKAPVPIWIEVGMKMRDVYPHVWRDLVLSQAEPGVLLVISDLRFRNEGERVHELGGWCVRVTRPDAPPPKGSDNEMGDAFPWDARLVNEGSVEELEAQAINVVLEYLEGFYATET